MTNAKNALKFKDIFKKYLSDKMPSMERATSYANEIMLVEAEAVFNRSVTAITVGLESQLKNKKYLELVKTYKNKPQLAISEIFTEMKMNGTVHKGKKKALDHYIAQYFQYNKK